MPKLYRSMRADDHDQKPRLSDTNASGLGVRVPYDIEPDEDGLVHPAMGGVSVAPDSPMNLPFFMHTPSMGGDATKPIWEIDSDDLTVGLVFERDGEKHGVIGPGICDGTGGLQDGGL